MRRLQFCLVLLTFLALTCSGFAQVQNGQFDGVVTDPTGAAIANAKITVSNPGTGLNQTATSNASGSYTVKELPIGTYKLTAEAPGFKTKSTAGVTLNAGVIAHVDFKMEIGKASEIVEVTGAAVAVQTDDAKLYNTVNSTVIENTVLQGRDVFDLMQISPGAVSVAGTDFENGHSTVVNGLREDFNGFLINGVSNKGLSGGEESTPIVDTVEEFQQLGLNMSAQYGNSAGSTVNLVTKGGTNAFHGSAFYYGRNEAADANDFFLNQAGAPRPEYRWHQWGGTFGGPIKKDKLFFFLAYEQSKFVTSSPTTIVKETPDWISAVHQADLNQAGQSYSVADLLYQKFPNTASAVPGSAIPIDTYLQSIAPALTSGFGCVGTYDPHTGSCSGLPGFTNNANYADYLCPDSYTAMGVSPGLAGKIATRMGAILGVVPGVDNLVPLTMTGSPCTTTLAGQTGTIGRDSVAGISGMNFQEASVASSKGSILGNFFHGWRYSGRLDYNWNANNRLSVNYQWQRNYDPYGPCPLPSCSRGFTSTNIVRSPNGQFSYTHTFSPTVLNEFRAGYVQNVNLISAAYPGVPQLSFDDASLGFGAYNGYPQYFRENIYSYGDMVSISHGNHNMKVGVDIRRNIENSQFSVARGSFYFSDPLFFAADAPYTQTAGVNPEICKPPCSQATIQALVSSNTVPNAQLESNVRHWRNLEFGAYFQDDWKVRKNLTLQLGLRYDLYRRHNEEANAATTFIPGPGSNVLEQLINANNPANCVNAAASAMAQLAGVCGPGGFAGADTLGKGRHKDFGPRVGFAWDVFGDGKTSLRGGFGISYEGTLYNPLSNSRWNLPYYSFNNVSSVLSNGSGTDYVLYGPSTCATGQTYPANCAPVGGAQFGPGGVLPVYSGAASNPNMGVGAQAAGNIDGWNGQAPNLALLTGIVFPKGIDDPYVYNFYLGFQREIMPKTVVELDYVGTAGHKLFRAEDINRAPGTLLPAGSSITNNVGELLTGYGHRPNANYGKLRVWENVVNSNYNSLQASVKRQLSHGLLVNVNYTYSHSIDDGSTWHSGATTANGAAGGEGFTTDPTNPGFDRGNSIFDIRHRLVVNHVWQLPGYNMKGPAGYLIGGWSLSGIWAYQTGPHWQPFRGGAPRLREISNPKNSCTAADIPSNCQNLAGDYLLTRGRNERPDSSIPGFNGFTHADWANGWGGLSLPNGPALTAPCLGCLGTLGRNTFVGPSHFSTDLTLGKNFKLTERVNLKFDAAAFNVFNHTNFLLATSGGGAHNDMRDGSFGKAGGTTLNGAGPRVMQFGMKLSF
jgi:hypothetical protein